jgi:hypothetical protein
VKFAILSVSSVSTLFLTGMENGDGVDLWNGSLIKSGPWNDSMRFTRRGTEKIAAYRRTKCGFKRIAETANDYNFSLALFICLC